MSTLTPANRQTTDELSFTSETVTEEQYNIRRRISSSIQPWEKQFYSPDSPRSPFSGNALVGEAKEEDTSPELTKSDDGSLCCVQQQQENATDDVEHEQDFSRDVGLKYHYDSGGNQNIIDNHSTRRHSRISMIIIYGREALCILALILTTYASIQNSHPRISKAPSPKPFFSRGSLVHDWPSGALGPTQTRVSQSELSFVFYYAPWCAESQHARSVYENVSRLYYREAHFAAINCWQPGGECRLQYSKVPSWPVLMAYQPNGLAVQYHQAWTDAALGRFVQSLITPLQRLTEPGDLMSFMSGKDAVVVAFLDIDETPKLYSRFYKTAMKWLEKDPFQEVAFGIVTGESTNAFGIDEIPSIRLYLWNETMEFSGNNSWTTLELTTWISKHIQVVSMWIAPPGATKSSSLAPYFNQGPVLFYFTPRSLYGTSSDAYMLLRQLGMQYYNCRDDIWVEEMAKRYITEQRRVYAETYVQFKKKCEIMLRRHRSQESEDISEGKDGCGSDSKSTIAVSFVNVLNSSKFTEGRQKGRSLGGGPSDYCEIGRTKCDERFYECPVVMVEDSVDVTDNSCAKGKRKHSSFLASHKHDSQTKKHVTSMLDSDQDYRGTKLLRKDYLRRQCEFLKISELDNNEIFFQNPSSQEDSYVDLIRGLSCKYNKTLTFLGMDSALYHAFAERLGVDVLNKPNRSVVMIVDHEDESTYLLREEISLASMAKFVHDFYNRTYPRFLRTNNVSFKNTHSFNTSEIRKESKRVMTAKKADAASKSTSGQHNKTQAKDSQGVTSDEQPLQYHFTREINSHNFYNAVINSNKTVIVHFYSTQCAFCSVLSQHLLTVSRMLQQQPRLDFVRIDGDKNDLQWEYTMDAFPTLIVFPSQRKSESRMFSRDLQMTVPNLLGFIFANLNPPERIHANYLICDEVQHSPSREECLLTIKGELSDSISLSLRQYRLTASRPSRAAHVLRRLQVLQEFYLNTLRCLSHSCDFSRLKSSAKTILSMWRISV
ncbi:thioredoxin domain-containing protein 11 [Malaya genurostris]|uniref:thioredoxin domain-containing protein 11 n=1 Tax=Malaya genurostris TaxID=325434 RepID=UPI0026F39CE9|nr:thioredoxin domain-containing protein 11 [Malaya genurostris]